MRELGGMGGRQYSRIEAQRLQVLFMNVISGFFSFCAQQVLIVHHSIWFKPSDSMFQSAMKLKSKFMSRSPAPNWLKSRGCSGPMACPEAVLCTEPGLFDVMPDVDLVCDNWRLQRLRKALYCVSH